MKPCRSFRSIIVCLWLTRFPSCSAGADIKLPDFSTFYSDSPDLSPIDPNSQISPFEQRNDSHKPNQQGSNKALDPKVGLGTATAGNDIAPWLSDGPSFSDPGGTAPEGRSKPQISPSFRPDTAQTGASESPDPMFGVDERRPSIASATTVSSQNSASRGSMSKETRHRHLTNIFGDGGRESSRNSNTSVIATGQRDASTASNARKDRQNSVKSLNAEGRPISPTNSRPRTPLPSSEVTPWLFQDFKVGFSGFFGHFESPCREEYIDHSFSCEFKTLNQSLVRNFKCRTQLSHAGVLLVCKAFVPCQNGNAAAVKS